MYTLKARFLVVFVLVCLLAMPPVFYARALPIVYEDVKSPVRAAPVSAGTYDDTNSNWTYAGAWTAYSGSGPNNNTMHYTSTPGDTATLQFTGVRFTLTFMKYSNRGLIDVYVDAAYVDTIDAHNSTLAWKQTYNSPVFPYGLHTVQFVHGGSGMYIDIDAIQIHNPVAAGIYDDTNSNLIYLGNWTAASGVSGPYNNTMHYTGSAGDSVGLGFNGTRFTLTFSKDANRGGIQVWVDGALETTIDTNNATVAWNQVYSSPVYPAGNHTINLVYDGNFTYIDIDAIQIYSAVPAGIYDDTDPNWVYVGPSWITYSGSGPSNNTMHYTSTVGNTAELQFNGVRFILTFTRNTNRGTIRVIVDGIPSDTIDASGGSLAWKQTYSSPILTPGNHTVQFEHFGLGTYIDIDSIQILGPVPTGTYDDADINWSYSGAWTAAGATPGPLNNTMHYTSTAGDYAELSFTGAKFVLTFARNSNRGTIVVSVDGAPAGTIDASNPTLLWKQTWTSPTYPVGSHVVSLQHGGLGAYIDIDAIQIYGAITPLTTGTYDDTHINWNYSGTWLTYSGSEPYNNTLHSTNTPTDYAEVQFSGIQFVLKFVKDSNRGSIEVRVDGGLVTTINASNPTRLWQQTYTSPSYPPGIHTVRLTHTGAAGTYIDIDSIQIIGSLASGTYDDNTRWTYTGIWTADTLSGPYNSTIHYTTAVGSYAEFSFDGTKFTLKFTKYSNRGSIEVRVDGAFVATINANNPTLAWQQTWESPTYTLGSHTVRLTHAGGAGPYIDVDAITVTQ